ncbi:hypothetical protein ACFFKH_09555 [Micromonospora marina]|uniref:Uncharacterized protein n=1 Tax=Micromonospora marina TaxID=307120 RepID=A0A1C4XBJ7_9ACTN|nr:MULTISPECIES: hypothetical protein [Micromonospora]SCF05923.1 hypothetical protein GA0070215_10738 [Micromonospora marina]
MPDSRIEDALRSLAGQAERFGQLPELTEIHERSRARRRHRRVATATLAVLLATGAVVVQPGNRPRTLPTIPATPPTTSSPTPDPVLAGEREVAIVRVTGSALSLDGGFLTEVDDDSGRQSFVPTPLGGGEYLIKAYGKRDGHPASDEPTCWRVYRETGQPLTVEGVVCDPDDPDQRFTITPQTPQTYAISNDSAYLRRSSGAGLVLDDAPQPDTFRFTDRGPTRKPAGG